jgi:hypothetical protein
VKPTKVLTLLGWVVPATTAGYLLSKIITSNGGQVPVTPINLLLTLLAISIILAGFALPMVRYRRALAEQQKNSSSPRPKRLNPFYAVRLLMLAKATAISGALFTGWHIGVIWMQLSSPVTTDSIWQNVGALIASITMVIVGLVVERICRIKDDGSEPLGGPTATAPNTSVTTTAAKTNGQITGKVTGKVTGPISGQISGAGETNSR